MNGERPSTAKTLATLALLTGALPLSAAVSSVALLVRAARSRITADLDSDPVTQRTVMISGGKMTKALHLARAFHRAGHRVVLVESDNYPVCAYRYSRAVDSFHHTPPPGSPGYGEALLDVIIRENVDVYVPVCSPASAFHDAALKSQLGEHCDVFHFDPATLRTLDDKFNFAQTADDLDLHAPDTHRITDPGQALAFNFDDPGSHPPYILKSIAYDPVHRLDLTPLPQPDLAAGERFVSALPISETNPWIMQAFISGEEYCTHSTVRNGRIQLHCCCRSSAWQLNYAMEDVPEIRRWVSEFCRALGLTGQVSFDFICADDGTVYAIECNPRTHSAITMFYDHPDVAAAYLSEFAADEPAVTPTTASRPTYWLYHELWRALSDPRHVGGPLGRIRHGKEAIFSWDDPLPFLLLHHAQIPNLLWRNLRQRGRWERIDFNIGKLVEPGGD